MMYQLRRCTVDVDRSACKNYHKKVAETKRVLALLKRLERAVEKANKSHRNQPTDKVQTPQAVFLENLNMTPSPQQPPPPPPPSNKKKKSRSNSSSSSSSSYGSSVNNPGGVTAGQVAGNRKQDEGNSSTESDHRQSSPVQQEFPLDLSMRSAPMCVAEQEQLAAPPQSRRQRGFSQHQLEELSTAFSAQPYPNLYVKKIIAGKTHLSVTQVTDWFCYRRKKALSQGDFSALGKYPPPPPPEPNPITSSAAGTDQSSECPTTTATRRSLRRLTLQQLECLETAFLAQSHPDIFLRRMLACEIGLRESQVTDWFANRRRRVNIKSPIKPFILWANEERAKIVKSQPELHDYVVTKLLECRWESMTSEEKQQCYGELAKHHMLKHPEYYQSYKGQHRWFFASPRLSLRQTEELESAYVHTHYPDTMTIEKLANRIGLCEARVRNWFKHRRYKLLRRSKRLGGDE